MCALAVLLQFSLFFCSVAFHVDVVLLTTGTNIYNYMWINGKNIDQNIHRNVPIGEISCIDSNCFLLNTFATHNWHSHFHNSFLSSYFFFVFFSILRRIQWRYVDPYAQSIQKVYVKTVIKWSENNNT